MCIHFGTLNRHVEAFVCLIKLELPRHILEFQLQKHTRDIRKFSLIHRPHCLKMQLNRICLPEQHKPTWILKEPFKLCNTDWCAHTRKKIPNWLRHRHRNFAKLIEPVNINKSETANKMKEKGDEKRWKIQSYKGEEKSRTFTVQ